MFKVGDKVKCHPKYTIDQHWNGVITAHHSDGKFIIYWISDKNKETQQMTYTESYMKDTFILYNRLKLRRKNISNV